MEQEYVVQLRGLNEIVYCKRLYHLMYAQDLFESSADTIQGKMNHDVREKFSKINELDGQDIFSMILYSPDGRLSGKLDGVRKIDGEYVPIEDKSSAAPDSEFELELWGSTIKTKAWINDFPQIVGQMYLLRSNGYKCTRGRIYYRGSNRMIDIAYQDDFDAFIQKGIEACVEVLGGSEPSPLIDSEKCIRCSLNWICLPDEINMLKEKMEEPRRLYPGRPDTSVLYVTTVGSKIGKSGETITIWNPEGTKESVPSKDIDNVCIFGNSQITTQAVHEIVKNGGGVYYFTSGGWLLACTTAPITKNIGLRLQQFSKFANEDFCLNLIKNLTKAKIMNQRTMLRRNHDKKADEQITRLKIIRNKIDGAVDIDSVRGYEGLAGMVYWEGFSILLTEKECWEMHGRNRRPPRDEINAMLSYGYSLLVRDFISAISGTGMDYLYGFFHTVVPGRPALALDMMEPYRPIIVDSVVLRLVNEEMVKKDDFARTEAGVFMSPKAKKKLIYMYEKRMDEMITHPQFGYRLSYRRMVHLEAKLLGKHINGELEEYLPLTTR